MLCFLWGGLMVVRMLLRRRGVGLGLVLLEVVHLGNHGNLNRRLRRLSSQGSRRTWFELLSCVVVENGFVGGCIFMEMDVLHLV